MECMLRHRGLLKDDDDSRKTEVMEEDLEEIIYEIGRDVVSVPSLCRTCLDSTIRTGVTLTGATNMDPPPIPDKSVALSYVEQWLETLPVFVRTAPTVVPVGENG